MCWWMYLDHNRGSRPRCVAMVDGPRIEVAKRLSRLVRLPEVTVSCDDKWMPKGTPIQNPDGTWDTTPADEARLGDPNDLLVPREQKQLKTWWLKHKQGANTPNWDIASTCHVGSKKGLLLIEAKAHDQELRGEEKGKSLKANASDNSFDNHLKIGRAIADAAAQMQRATFLPCAITRDNHYQMSNRFAWACKLTELGYAVILVYLGFLKAGEMADEGAPFASHAEWQALVESHSEPLFPKSIWKRKWEVNGQTFIPLIRSTQIDYDCLITKGIKVPLAPLTSSRKASKR